MPQFVTTLILIFFAFISVTSAATEKTGNDVTRPLAPYFHIEDPSLGVDQLPLKNTSVTAGINGVIADVKVVQQYANIGQKPIHARYIFPGSTRAAVHGMRMEVGNQVIVARIQEREEAKKTFETAKTEGKSASLLTQERPNVFSMAVANIMPGDTIKIELHYTELLVPTEGIYEFVFPTVVGPRYGSIPEAGAADHHQWIKSPYLSSGTPPTSQFEITTHVGSPFVIQDLECPSHQTDIAWENPANATVSLHPSETEGNNRDYILRYRLAGGQTQTGFMSYRGTSENYFMVMVQPPAQLPPDAVPAREYIFVVDVSGSMSGFPLETAKVLMEKLIGGLKQTDRFNVILFEAGSQVLFPQSVPASSQFIEIAKTKLTNAQGGGGTELKLALEKAFRLPRTDSVSRSIVVVTDGYISVEKEVFSLIRDNLARNNVFAFGIGSSVNRYLIEGIAQCGQGEPFIVTKGEEAASVATRFKTYVESPLLTDIRVRYEGLEVYDLEPAGFGDLFANRPLIVCGKWRGNLRGEIVVSGTNGTGPFKTKLQIDPAANIGESRALPFLWARKRLAQLSDYGEQPDESRKKEITDLGLKHHLLTRFTSFVAVDETVRNPNDVTEVNQPLPMPLHVSNLAIGNSEQVPEPDLWIMAMLLLFGLLGIDPGRKDFPKNKKPGGPDNEQSA